MAHRWNGLAERGREQGFRGAKGRSLKPTQPRPGQGKTPAFLPGCADGQAECQVLGSINRDRRWHMNAIVPPRKRSAVCRMRYFHGQVHIKWSLGGLSFIYMPDMHQWDRKSAVQAEAHPAEHLQIGSSRQIFCLSPNSSFVRVKYAFCGCFMRAYILGSHFTPSPRHQDTSSCHAIK